ncbi:uncharacterized protein METZ01_LOCUS194456, partial [marine metagenome]
MKHLLLTTIAAMLSASSLVFGERPNIVFIMSDDHALEAIGAYGSWLKKYCPTPT